MSVLMQINPFDFFTDQDGTALDEGYIWIGEPNKDPRAFPVPIYYNQEKTIVAPQPIRTNGGYAVRDGAPTYFFIDGNYSVLVLNKKGVRVFFVPDFLLMGSGKGVSFADLAAENASTLITYKGSDAGSIPLTLQTVLDDRNAYPFQFGAIADGVHDDSGAWTKAFATGKLVDGLGHTYLLNGIKPPDGASAVRANIKVPDSQADGVSCFEWDGTSSVRKKFLGIGLRINGNREGQTNIGFGASGDGNRHGFWVNGAMENFVLTDCAAINCATDGLALFGASAGVSFAIKNVHLNNCDFQDNRRHGASVDTLRLLRVNGGRWINNGNDLPNAFGQPITSGWYGARVGSVAGPQYGNGCDIESYGADINYSTHIEDAEFEGVEMTGNYSGGFKLLAMPGTDVNISTWRPMKNIKIKGGVYDEGLAPPSAETSPIQVGSTGLLPVNKIGVEDFYVWGAKCSSSIAINNTSGASINCSIDRLNGGPFKYHAFIQNSKNIDLNLITTQPLAIYNDNSTVTSNRKITSVTAPTCSITGGAITSQTSTLVSSSLQAGQLYRINILCNMTLAVGSSLQLDFLGGRTILDASGSYLNQGTSEIKALFFRSAGPYILLRPDTQGVLEVVLYVTAS